MPQLQINSLNIDTLSCSVDFDIQNRSVVFDTSGSTYNNISGHGILYVQGISFLLKDQDGVVLTPIDFSNPANYIVPSATQIFTLDLSYLNYAFLFQTYEIIIAIKDQDGTIYQTTPIYPNVCQPIGFTESGYVYGMFRVIPNCTNNYISVSEVTPLVYNGQLPTSVSKSGMLYYPTGTISPVTFTGTPFQNNQIFTGSYRIKNTTVGQYSLGNMVYVSVGYYTDNVFNVQCGSRVYDLICCIDNVQRTAIRECGNAIGLQAQQQLLEISTYFMSGIAKEGNGQDSTPEYEFIKKVLNCNCGATSIQQNEQNPINPAVYSILVTGTNGTTVTPSTNGNTTTYLVSSNIYQIVKGNTGDLAFTIATDTTTPNIVKYVITFNYAVMANYILTAIGNSDTLTAQLNALVTVATSIDLTNLNGGCVIDLSSVNYFLSQLVPSGATVISNITIGDNTYNAPVDLLVSNESGVEAWLNGLGMGVFNSSFSNSITGAYFNLLTVGNSNMPTGVTLNISGSTSFVPFQKTNKSLIAVLQAIIDYLCNITALQIALGDNLSLCSFDYNGNIVTTNYTIGNTQNNFNAGVSSAICNIANRINTLTAVTCAKIQGIFQDYPNSQLGITGRLYGTDGVNCVSWTTQQTALAVIAAIGSYSNVKTAFCAIDCTAPATCPDISNISLAMAGSSIGIYGLTWEITPTASQTVTIRYRVTGTSTWFIATNALLILPNGNISGTTPYTISGVSTGTTYDIQAVNNCGGAGFIKQITTPTGSVYSGNYLLNNVIYNICGGSPFTLYSSAPFGTGVTMYTDVALTMPITGFTLITSVTGGFIYNLNSSTGVVGASTGASCSTGTAANYILGTDTDTLCNGEIVVLYTNGAFEVGDTLYTDPSLTHPVSNTYNYVMWQGNNHIYNLSDAVVGLDTGLTCSSGSVTAHNTMTDSGAVVTSIIGIPGFALSGSLGLNQTQTGVHTAFSGATLSFSVTGTLSGDGVDIYINSIFQSRVNMSGGTGTYFANNISANLTDTILLDFNNDL